MISYFKKHLSRMGLLAFFVDFSILLFTGVLAMMIINRMYFFNQPDLNYIHIIYTYLIAFILLSQISLFVSELYITEKKYQKKILIFKCFISFVIVSIACYVMSSQVLPYSNYFFLSMTACTLILCWRFIFYWVVQKISIQHKVLFFGTDELSQMVVKEILADDHPGFKVVGFVSTDPSLVGKNIVTPRVLGIGKDLASIVEKEKVDRLVVSFPQGMGTLASEDLLFCKFKGIRVQELHTFYEHLKGKILINGLRPGWLIFTEGFNKTIGTLLLKRAIDILLSCIGLILALPISLITSILIKLDSNGPIIYQQDRVGADGRIFSIYKFRSMRTDAEKYSGPVWAEENDPRVTRVGRFIRNFHIDEIPQMLNVLKGDMSFVGPRPERPVFVEKLQEVIPYYNQRHTVKPGITGWAAVNYRYGSSVEDVIEKWQYDLYYIKNFSIFLDFVTILKTVTIIIGRRGAR